MPTLRLRAMRKADLSWVAQAERQLFSAEAWSPQLLASELDAMESLDDRIYVVAEVDATMAGYAGVWRGDSADVLTIATLPYFRRQGVGRALLNALLDAAAERECEAVLLEVRASNDGAIALYKEAGFKAIAKRRAYYTHPREDAVVMRKKLAAGLFSKSRVP